MKKTRPLIAKPGGTEKGTTIIQTSYDSLFALALLFAFLGIVSIAVLVISYL